MFNLDKLEFNNIRETLAKYTQTFEGENLALSLEPSSRTMEVKSWLNETNECLQIRNIKGELPISQMDDVSFLIKSLKSSLSLSAKGLLEMSNILRTARELTEYIKDLEAPLPTIKDYFSMLYSNKDIENKISSCIISEDIIADNASQKLYSIRNSKKASNKLIVRRRNGK